MSNKCDHCKNDTKVDKLIILPCGYSICYDHFTDVSDNFECLVCNDHSIDKTECFKMKRNQKILNEINFNEKLKSLNLTIQDFETINVDPLFIVEQKFSKLQNQADLNREKIKIKLDEIYEQLTIKINESKEKYASLLSDALKEQDLKNLKFDPESYSKIEHSLSILEEINGLRVSNADPNELINALEIKKGNEIGDVTEGGSSKSNTESGSSLPKPPRQGQFLKISNAEQIFRLDSCEPLGKDEIVGISKTDPFELVFWNFRTNTVRRLSDLSNIIDAILVTPDNKIIRVSSTGILIVYEYKCVNRINTHKLPIIGAELWGNDKIITGHEDGSINIWNLTTGQFINSIKVNSISGFILFKNDFLFVFDYGNKTNVICDLKTCEIEKSITQSFHSIYSFENGKLHLENVDDRHFIVYNQNGLYFNFDIESSDSISFSQLNVQEKILKIQVCQDNKCLNLSVDGTIKCWDYIDGKFQSIVVSDTNLNIQDFKYLKTGVILVVSDTEISVWA